MHDEILRGDQHAGRAEAALQRVAAVKRLLQLGQLARVRQSLDGVDAPAVRLHREHEAAAHDLAVDADRARAARSVLAARVRPGQAQVFPQEIDQVLARRNAPRHGAAVDRQRGFDCRVHDVFLRRRAPRARGRSALARGAAWSARSCTDRMPAADRRRALRRHRRPAGRSPPRPSRFARESASRRRRGTRGARRRARHSCSSRRRRRRRSHNRPGAAPAPGTRCGALRSATGNSTPVSTSSGRRTVV